MCDLTQRNSSLMKTVDLWETVIVSESTNLEALVLEIATSLVPVPTQGLLPGQSMNVGRTWDSDMRVPCDKKMSRTHFSIECHDDHAIVRDLRSTNGTFVNGMSTQESKVYDGDQIVAGTTTFTVRLFFE